MTTTTNDARWPDLILHLFGAGAAMPDGRDVGRALGELVRAWRAGDVPACERLATPLFDALDAQRRALLASPGFPEVPASGDGASQAQREWSQCSVAQASVALTMAVVAWLTGRGDALVARMPSLVAMMHPEWEEHFPSGPTGDAYFGPTVLPVGARAAAHAAMLVAESFAPGALHRALPERTGRIDPVMTIQWMTLGVMRGLRAGADLTDGRLAAAAVMHAILTQRGANLGTVEDPLERRLAAAAHGAALERAWMHGQAGPLGERAIDLAVAATPMDRRAAMAERLALLANAQHDAGYQAVLRDLAARVRASAA